MLYEESTSGTREFMMSAATRPEKGEVGSVEEKVLWVKDPKQQKHIEAMDGWNKKRFNDSTAAEKNGFFQDPKIAQRIRITDVPAGATIMNTMCIWVTKFLQGKYEKTKARIVVRGGSSAANRRKYICTDGEIHFYADFVLSGSHVQLASGQNRLHRNISQRRIA